MTGRSDFFFFCILRPSRTQEASRENAVKHEADVPLVGASIVNVFIRKLRQRITSYSSSFLCFLGSLFNHHAHHTLCCPLIQQKDGVVFVVTWSADTTVADGPFIAHSGKSYREETTELSSLTNPAAQKEQ